MAANIFGSSSKANGNIKTGDAPAPNVKLPDAPEKKESSPKPVHKRSFTLEFSLSGLITTSIFTLIAVGFVFVFGLMLGRGYNPEEHVPEIAQFLPELKPAPQDFEETILRPEDLEFMTALKEDDVMGLPEVLPDGSDVPEQAEGALVKQAVSELNTVIKEEQLPEKVVAEATRTTIKPSQSLINAKVPATSSGKNSGKEAANSLDSKLIYDFVYQVVAYKGSNQAERLRVRLEEDGFRTRVQSQKLDGGAVQWYRVQVLFRGNDERAAMNKERFERFGIKDAVIVSKERVGR